MPSNVRELYTILKLGGQFPCPQEFKIYQVRKQNGVML